MQGNCLNSMGAWHLEWVAQSLRAGDPAIAGPPPAKSITAFQLLAHQKPLYLEPPHLIMMGPLLQVCPQKKARFLPLGVTAPWCRPPVWAQTGTTHEPPVGPAQLVPGLSQEWLGQTSLHTKVGQAASWGPAGTGPEVALEASVVLASSLDRLAGRGHPG